MTPEHADLEQLPPPSPMQPLLPSCLGRAQTQQTRASGTRDHGSAVRPLADRVCRSDGADDDDDDDDATHERRSDGVVLAASRFVSRLEGGCGVEGGLGSSCCWRDGGGDAAAAAAAGASSESTAAARHGCCMSSFNSCFVLFNHYFFSSLDTGELFSDCRPTCSWNLFGLCGGEVI